MKKQYRKKANQFITAVQLSLETDGFSYKKWGALQNAKAGDWLVNNGDDTYTIDQDVFKNTYRKSDAGKYIKITPVWAEVASQAGSVKTKEGKSYYKQGDYLVSNNNDGSDAYCISADKFLDMYEALE